MLKGLVPSYKYRTKISTDNFFMQTITA